MIRRLAWLTILLLTPAFATAANLSEDVARDYGEYLWPLFDHFHRNPELSTIGKETAARMALELRKVGLEVTEGVGGTGVVGVAAAGAGRLKPHPCTKAVATRCRPRVSVPKRPSSLHGFFLRSAAGS